jgi:hypothetical protein
MIPTRFSKLFSGSIRGSYAIRRRTSSVVVIERSECSQQEILEEKMLRKSLFPLVLSLLFTISASASSHRENPNAQFDNALDSTDTYMFRSPDAPDTITLVANYYPFIAPCSAPNWAQFDPKGKYLIHIDNNGDAVEDITFEFIFKTGIRNPNSFLYATGPIMSIDSANYNIYQTYTLTRIDGPYATGTRTVLLTDVPVPPANVGPKSTPAYEQTALQAVKNLPNGGKVFAGLRDDPFFIDLGAVFDLLTLRPIQQLHRVPPMMSAGPGYDYVAKLNVLAIVLQVPISQLTAAGEPVIACGPLRRSRACRSPKPVAVTSRTSAATCRSLASACLWSTRPSCRCR